MEMTCYSKILRISYKDHAISEEVRAKIQEAIGPHDDLLTIVKRHKLKWYRQSPVCQRHKLKWYRQSPVYQVWPKPSCKAQ